MAELQGKKKDGDQCMDRGSLVSRVARLPIQTRGRTHARTRTHGRAHTYQKRALGDLPPPSLSADVSLKANDISDLASLSSPHTRATRQHDSGIWRWDKAKWCAGWRPYEYQPQFPKNSKNQKQKTNNLHPLPRYDMPPYPLHSLIRATSPPTLASPHMTALCAAIIDNKYTVIRRGTHTHTHKDTDTDTYDKT